MRQSRQLLAYFVLFSIALTARLIAQGTNSHTTWKLLTPSISGMPGEVVDVKVQVKLVPKAHIYSTRTKGAQPTEVSAGDKNLFTLGGKIRADKRAVRKYDENFEDTTEYWDNGVTFTVPVKIAKNAKEGKAKGWVNFYYMTCDDARCLPPTDQKFTITVDVKPDTAKGEGIGLIDTTAVEPDETEAGPARTDTIAQAPASGNNDTTTKEAATVAGGGSDKPGDTTATAPEEQESLIAYLLRAMGLGFAALFTPCVYPLIPITVSFFTKRRQTTRRRNIRDAGVYALGIILTFSLIGLIASLIFGATGLNDFAANPIANILIGLVFLTLALSLFGLFEIQVPTSILNRLNRTANDKGDGVVGILLMALVFTLTSFTCTVPFVAGAFTSASQGEFFRPMIGTAAFAFVFSLPFFGLALFPALLKSLPKSGGWLNSVKVVLGFVEVAFAMKFFANVDLYYQAGILTREAFLAIWVSLAIMTSIYLLGRFQMPHDSPVEKLGPVRVLFSVGFLAVGLWMVTGLFGGRLGEVDPFIPPQVYPGKGNTSLLATAGSGGNRSTASIESSGKTDGKADPASDAHEAWIRDDYEKALKISRETGKPLFVDFTGQFCTNCRWMEENMFTRIDVKEKLNKYVLVQLYTDLRDPASRKNRQMLLDRFNTIALPYYALITPGDSVMHSVGFDTKPAPKDFISFLEKGLVKTNGAVALK